LFINKQVYLCQCVGWKHEVDNADSRSSPWTRQD